MPNAATGNVIPYIPHENGEVFVFFQKHEYKAYHGLMAINHDHQ